ncbi:uroporphyrinogen-III C-methyltransferase [Thalassotalea maritima]|uniref:uroporphyrinogen-III C-methyltransferase n=1 Tax=Thalassotalea maritima TaxID=3242416 RepID=UPI0035270FA2
MTEDKQNQSKNDKTESAKQDSSNSSNKPSTAKTTQPPSLSSSDAATIAADAKRHVEANQDNKSSDKPASSASNTDKASTAKITKPTNKAQTKSIKPSNTVTHTTRKRSKTAVIALLVAVFAGAGVVASYWWQQQQDQQQSNALLTKTQAQVAELEKYMQQQIRSQNSSQQQQLQQSLSVIEEQTQQRIATLEAQIQQLLERQPENWQVTEAEYLMRMAGRTLWLDKDTKTAINLMQDADARLKDLKDARFYRVRELIHEDIEALRALPVLELDQTILTLMALSKQVSDLPRPEVLKPEVAQLVDSTALSNDVNDWRENLAKTWQRFKEEFIIPRRLKGQVEPLMSADLEKNLYQNIDLKFQLAIWAASRGDTQTYQQTISDISSWVGQYFDRTQHQTQTFNARLVELKNTPITVQYPNELASQQALKQLIEQNITQPVPPAESEPDVISEPKPEQISEGNI